MADVPGQNTRHPGHHAEWNFPYAHVIWRTQDGSVLMVNEENGKNSIIMQHGVSGTYTEINNSGDSVNFTTGHLASYGKSGTSFTIDNNGDVKFGGHQRVLLGGGSHIEVSGHAGITVGGDTALVGMGKVNVRAKSLYLGSDGDISMNAGGKIDVQAAGEISIKGSSVGTHGQGGVYTNSSGGPQPSGGGGPTS